ncbi:MAG TPA: hypothetical protein P5081_13545 [Phycisphaerae bacterium]|nr:hypothetical protein [Phycisphaerae bacterium]HRW53901.1 hypothetical protein [Phycisphaerae bacterium]
MTRNRLHRQLIGLLLVATAAAFIGFLTPVSSNLRRHRWRIPGSERTIGFTRSGRNVIVEFTSPQRTPQGPGSGTRLDIPGLRVGFSDFRATGAESGSAWAHRCTRVDLSLWLVALLLASYPACWFLRRAVRRHQTPDATSACASCQYNLRGNESGVCPECGVAIDAAA